MPRLKEHHRTFYKHRLPMRLAHWVSAVCLFILLLSGLQIFNAHPYLYWGSASNFDAPWLAIDARNTEQSGIEGQVRLYGHSLETTGVLGLSGGEGGNADQRAFPSWLTIPGGRWLSMGRSWHFFFAWLLVINASLFLVWAAFSGHLRELIPTRADWRGFGGSVMNHIKFRHPTGEAATRYNVLQKLAYLFVIFGLGSLIVTTGLCMSPRMDTVMSDFLTLYGGRQSARSIHFLAAAGLVLFVVVHLFEVIITGPLNNLRSVITGHYRYRTDAEHNNHKEKHDD